MSKDFRASQIETSKLIASGGITGTTIGLAIYSGSIASNRAGSVTDSTIFSNVGSDVFLFVSGTRSNSNFNRSQVSLFGGDVVISGTLYAERQVIEVDSVADGDFIVTGSLFVEPDSNSTKSVAFRKADGTDILIVDSTNSRVGIGVTDPDSTLEILSTSTQLKLSNNASDFSTFAVGNNGDLTITTVDAAGGNANLSLVVDGAVDIDADQGALSLDGSSGINIGTETDVAIDIDSSTLDIDASGAITIDSTSTITISGDTGASIGDDTEAIAYDGSGNVDFDAVALDIDASGAITIDGTSTLSLDASDSTNLTMAANAGSNKTMTISATNANASYVSNIDVDADGSLTLNGAAGATFGDDTEAIAYDGSGNVDFDAVALDLDVTDSSSITITSSEAGEDLTIEQVGGNDSSIIITAAGTGTDAIKIDATAGDMVIGPSLADGKTLKLGKASAAEITIAPHGTAANEKITLTNTAGTADDAIKLESTAGGVTILAGNDSLVLDANGTDADAINIDSAGGIDIDAAGAVAIDSAGIFSVDGVGTSNITTNGKLVLSGSTHVDIRSDSGPILIAGSKVFGSGGPPATPFGTDVKIMLSGTIGTRGTATRGTTSITGDANISGSFGFSQVASVPSHSSNQAILYAKDDSGVTKLFTKQSNGIEIGPLGSGGSLDDAYDTPAGGGSKSTGIGALITVDGQPVQIATSGGKTMGLAVTGSAAFGNISSEFSNQLPPMPGNDTSFFVSGTIGSRGSSVKGTAVYGGDLVVSGTLSVNRGQAGAGSVVTITTDGKVGIGTDTPSTKLEVGGNATFGEYLYHRGDTDTFIQFAEDSVGISVGSEQLVTIAQIDAGQDFVKIGDGGDVDFQVRTNGDDNTLYVEGATDRIGIGTNSPVSILHVKELEPTISIQRENNSKDSTIAFLGSGGNTGAIMHLSSSNDLVFKTHDGSSPQEILRLGGHQASDVRQIIMLSGSDMHAGAMQPKEKTDINFFVSGAIGSKGTATRGTAVFGGDVVISGTLHGGSPLKVNESITFSGTHTGDTTTAGIYKDASGFLKFKDDGNVLKTLSDLASSGVSSQHFIAVHGNSPATSKIKTTGSISFAGALNDYVDNLGSSGVGSDVFLFFSGSKSSINGSSRGLSLFSGDTFTSGSINTESSLNFTSAAEIDVATGNLTIDVAGDIALSADGDQITMDDGTTTRFTFNLDSTPELDVVGNFTIDSTGNIELNADGGTIDFKDDTESLMQLTDSGITFDDDTVITATDGNLSFKATGINHDIIFAVDDAGIDVDPVLTIDGSNNGSLIHTPRNSGYLEVNDADTDGLSRLYGMGYLRLDRYSDTATTSPVINFRRSRGSDGSEAAVQSGDRLGHLGFYGYDTSAGAIAAEIRAVASADHGSSGDSSDSPGKLEFYTTPDGTSTSTLALTINSDQTIDLTDNLTIGGDSDGSDRLITFGHSTLKSVIGIDDSQDVFAINTDASFETANDLEIDASGNVTLGNGTLTIGGNVIKASDGGSTITMDASDNVTIGGDLQINGNDIKSSGGNTVLSFDSTGEINEAIVINVNGAGQYLFSDNTNTANPELHFMNIDTSITTGNNLGAIWFKGSESSGAAHDGGVGGGYFIMEADATWNSNDYPTRLSIGLTDDGTSSPIVRARLDHDGDWLTEGNHFSGESLFTEGHRYSSDEEIEPGDAVVLINGKIVKSSSPMQKNVAGIAFYKEHEKWKDWPLHDNEESDISLHNPTTIKDSFDNAVNRGQYNSETNEWEKTEEFKKLWKLASVGDSRQGSLTGFKICNEGGEVEPGDLLCTSSTAGYLMKQSDDIIRSYTVGKSMESVSFDSEGKATGIYGYVYCG